jgi:glycoside/pentoside/hexuronide:cation symporter, GPH family
VTTKLSLKTKAGFGVCDLGGNLLFTAMGFWALNYLTDTVGLTAAAAGFAIMIGKIWDAVTDPVMGYISDRTRSRFGRRRPYILLGAIPLGLSMWFFFTNPGFGNPVALLVWATVALCMLNTTLTIVNIPYSALTPELTSNYNEQTILNSWRFGFAIIGTILGAAIVLPTVQSFPTRSAGFSAAGLIMGSIMALTALITFATVREPGHETKELPTTGLLQTYLSVFRNKAFVILIITYALNILAINFLQGILVYYFKYIYHAEAKTTGAMVILLCIAMAVIPLSIPLSKKIGKKATYQAGFSLLSLTCFVLYFAGHRLGINFFYIMMGLAGVGLGLAYVAPWAMVPDTIEWDAVKTGNRKEGSYYGMWTFISKLGQALSIATSGFILGRSGYIADAEQTATAIGAIRLLLGPIPGIVFLAAIAVLCAYPITEKVYNELMSGGRRT